jgi:hypothetical protein
VRFSWYASQQSIVYQLDSGLAGGRESSYGPGMAPEPKPPTESSVMIILAQALFSIAFAIVTVAVVDFIMWAVS